MFQLKIIRRREAETGVVQGAGSGRSGDALIARIDAALVAELEAQPLVAGEVRKAVQEWVNSELCGVKERTATDDQDFERVVGASLRQILGAMVEEREPGVLQLRVPLVTRVPAQEVVQAVVQGLITLHKDAGRRLGGKSADTVVKNLCRVSKLTEQQARERPYRLKFPKDIEETDAALAATFLGGTPIGKLLQTPVAVTITDRARLAHGVCVAGSGHGKSQLLGAILAAELSRPKGQETGLVILDDQSDLVNKIKRLKAFAGHDRLLLVDAGDIAHPIASNLFVWPGAAASTLPLVEREQALMARIELTEYVISGLFGSDMTSRQGTLFRYLIQLMLTIEGASLETLRQCLEDPEQFRGDIEKLDGMAKAYLLNQFMSKGFNPVRKQVLQRLYAVLQSGVFARMFGAKTNRLDIGKALDAGRIVLVNTSKQALGEQSKVFGRFIIALVMRAVFDRARIPEEARRPSFLLIDEAASYFSDDDRMLETLLTQARKYKLGCMMFLQSLEQMPTGLRGVVLANCSVKLAGGVGAKCARQLAAEMRCSEEFILSQVKDGEATQFATFVRNTTPRAVSWRVPFLALESMPVMSEAEYETLLARCRDELCDW